MNEKEIPKELITYTPKELENILDVKREAIWKYIRSGKLKAKKIGKEWRITVKALEEFLSPDE